MENKTRKWSLVRRGLTGVSILYLLLFIIAMNMHGCTKMVWQSALVKDLYLNSITGVASISNIDTNTSRFLIVSYTQGVADLTYHQYWFALPIINGRVPELFDYKGTKTTGADILHDLPKDRLNQIQHYRFPSKAYYPQGWDARKIDVKQESEIFTEEGIFCKADYVSQIPEYAAYKIIQLKGDTKLDLASKTIILPVKQPRLPTERYKDIIITAIFTPVTVAIDALLIPFWLLS